MAKDFVDLDLSPPPAGHVEVQTAADRLARQKDEMAGRVASAAEEIERLRMRQEELEYAKKALQELNRKQDEYTRSKKELIGSLTRSLLLMEKDEIRANRMVELLSVARKQCKSMLGEIRAIREEHWDDAHFEEDLNRGLALLENVRMDFNKSAAKIDAENRSAGNDSRTAITPLDDAARWSLANKGFCFWLKVGFALTLPVLLLLGVLAGVYLYGSWR